MALDRTQQPPVTPFGPLSIPMPRLERLRNNALLYIIDKGDQEVTRIDILFEGGRYAARKPVVADLTGPMLRRGIPSMDADAIAEHLDYHGAWMQTGTTQHYSAISLFSLNRNLDKTLPVVEQMIVAPTFPEEAFEVLRGQRMRQLSINRQKVSFLAAEAFNGLLFGEEHPYATITTEQDLQELTTHDLREYHNRYYLNSHVSILLSGHITDEVISQVDTYLGNIPVADGNAPCIVAPITSHPIKTRIIDKPDALQSGIRMGHLVTGAQHPDYPHITMLNLILGGYFGSRLMTNIREEKGYTYGISSHIISMRNGAYLTIATEAGTQYTQLLIDEVRNEMLRLCNEPVSIDELETARNYLQGLRARALDSAFSMCDYFVSSIISGNPIDYFNKEDAVIRTTTPDELMRIARTYFHPDMLYTAIAGDKKAFT